MGLAVVGRAVLRERMRPVSLEGEKHCEWCGMSRGDYESLHGLLENDMYGVIFAMLQTRDCYGQKVDLKPHEMSRIGNHQTFFDNF